MSRRSLLAFAAIATLCALLTPAAAPTRAAGPQQFSRRTVQLAWFYKPPANGDIGTLNARFDSFILTKNDEQVRDQLQALGTSAPILQYLRFEAIMDPGSCTAQPWRNQVADRIGDFCAISANHPDWFLLDSRGNRVQHEKGWFYMDPANTGWRAFWMERMRLSQETLGWHGVFLDNVEGSYDKLTRKGIALAKYRDQGAYRRAVLGFLAEMYTSYFQPTGRPLLANLIEFPDKRHWWSYMPYLDGAMDEGWAVDWSKGHLSARTWEEHLGRAERMQREGKRAILISQGAQGNAPRQLFAYASYLLIADGGAAFRYADDAAYHEIWLYDSYAIDLGAPRGPRRKVGGSWVREFAGGVVVVNPARGTASITTR